MKTKTVYIYLTRWEFDNQWKTMITDLPPKFWKDDPSKCVVLIDTREIELPPMPTDAELAVAQVDNIKEMMEKAEKKHRGAMQVMREKISQLTALTHDKGE
tara:strand:- start:354 stop:656 length:303 start_codon:yes stop_codon:yes gene_type:complete